MPTAKTTYKIAGWEESTWHENDDGTKLTRATVKREYSGDLEGTSHTEYVMSYAAGGTALYTGYERFEGTVFSKVGSFVMENKGCFEGGMAKTDWTVVDGSGRGELEGISGSGHNELGHAESHEIEMEFEGL